MDIYMTGVTGAPFKTPATNSENDTARIVYFLTLTGRSLRQVTRLIKTIYHPESYIFIHVDARKKYLYEELVLLINQLNNNARFPQNIKKMQQRFPTIWGGSSLLTMLLKGMEELLQQKDWKWDFVLNLSESDFPLKPPKELVTFLSKKSGYNFVRSHGSHTRDFIRKQSLEKTFYECDNHLWKLGNRTFPHGIQLDGGSDWFCLHRTFVDYVVHSEDDLMHGLKQYFHYALLPAEAFFHIALRNSPFCSTVINNNLRLVNWKRNQGCKCQHKAVVDACGCSPNVLQLNDMKKINSVKEKDVFFGRKFEALVDQNIINKVDQLLLGVGNAEISILQGQDAYWENLYHYQENDSLSKPELLSMATIIAQQSLLDRNIKFRIRRIKEITIYRHKDTTEGILLLFETYGLDHKTQVIKDFEALVSIPTTNIVLPNIATCSLGSEYDVKELIFRNQANVFGPLTDIGLMCPPLQPHPSLHSFSLRVQLFDPLTETAFDDLVTINSTSETEVFTSPSELSKPKLPGWWTVKLEHCQTKHTRTRICSTASMRFLVLPILPNSSNFTESELSLLNFGPPQAKPVSGYLTDYFRRDKSSLDGLKTFFKSFPATCLSEHSLVKWARNLAKDFFSVRGLCLAGPAINRASIPVEAGRHAPTIPSCFYANWSSLSPDPKSTLNGLGLDVSTARINGLSFP
jgi:protein xylosyltransferase